MLWTRTSTGLTKLSQGILRKRPFIPQSCLNTVIHCVSYHRIASQDALYQPIKHWQTRLLRLAPGSFDEPLRVDIDAATLVHSEGLVLDGRNEIVAYDALSYCWGSKAAPATITCGSHTLAISSSLSSALRHLRHANTARHLWVDALCINQSDPLEKSVQIQQMMTIFEKAETVVAWLGESTAQTRAAFKLMRVLHNREVAVHHDNGTCHITQDLLQEIHRLFSSAWLARTWVRQEIFTARSLVVRCGNASVTWEEFMGAAVRAAHGLSNPDCSSAKDVWKSTELPIWHYASQPSKGRMSLKGKPYLLDLLADSHRFRVTDERDIIYGIIGMTSTSTSTTSTTHETVEGRDNTAILPIDYRRTVSQVFQDVFKYLLNSHSSLALLSLSKVSASTAKYGAKEIGLPTWAIDWRYPCDAAVLRQYLRGLSKEDTKKQWHSLTTPRKQAFDNSPDLCLTGFRICRIIPSTRYDRIRRVLPAKAERYRISQSEKVLWPSEAPSTSIGSHFNLVFDLKFAEVANSLRSDSQLYFQNYMLDRQTWLNALRKMDDSLQGNDICVYLEGARCQHILRPIPDSGKFTLVGAIDILPSITQYMDRMVAHKGEVLRGNGTLEDFVIK